MVKKSFNSAVIFFLFLNAVFFAGCNISSVSWNGDLKSSVDADVSTTFIFYSSNVDGYDEAVSGSPVKKSFKIGESCLASDFPSELLQNNNPGYVVSGWKFYGYSTSAAEETVVPENVLCNEEGFVDSVKVSADSLIFYAQWKIDTNVKYQVHHYLENAEDSEYTVDDSKTETLYGTAFAETSAAALEITGFTAGEVLQQKIQPDGSTDIKIYYTRKIYVLNFDGGTGTLSSPSQITGKYGSKVPEVSDPVPPEKYGFDGWRLSDSSEIIQLPETFPAENISYTAVFSSNEATYKVEYYGEKTDGSFELFNSMVLNGYAGEKPVYDSENITDSQKEMYVYSESESEIPEKILKDGSTIVKLYYNLKTVTLTFELAGGSTETVLEADPSLTSGGILKGKYSAPVEFKSPEWKGYKFGGWLDENGSSVEIPSVFTKDQKFTAVWTVDSAETGITISLPEYSGETVSLETSEKDGVLTLKAASGFASYQWIFDGTVMAGASSETISVDFKNYEAGLYEAIVLVEDSSGKKSSASVEITITKNKGGTD